MVKYKIEIKKSAVKELKKIPAQDIKKVARRIKSLAANPRPEGSEKLTGHDFYRVRQGNYRIVYSIEDRILTVLIIKIGHRKDIYR